MTRFQCNYAPALQSKPIKLNAWRKQIFAAENACTPNHEG